MWLNKGISATAMLWLLLVFLIQQHCSSAFTLLQTSSLRLTIRNIPHLERCRYLHMGTSVDECDHEQPLAVQVRGLHWRQLPAVTLLVAEHFASPSTHPPLVYLFLLCSISYFYGIKLFIPRRYGHWVYGAFDGEQRLVGTADLSLQRCDGALEALRLTPWRQRQTSVENRDSLQAYVCNVLVKESHRQRGIGRQLLQRCEGEATRLGCATIHLHVDHSDEAAIRFYEKIGFVQTKRLDASLFLSKSLTRV